MKRPAKYISLILLIALSILLIPATALAASSYLGEAGGRAEPMDSPDVELEKLVIQVWLRKGFAEVEEVYQFYNSGEAQGIVMGMPEVVNTKASLKYGLYNFRAYVDGKSVDTRVVKARDQRVGTSFGNINWHANSLFIGERERKIVVHKYWLRVIPWENKLAIPLEPAASWKGRIGEAYFTTYLMGNLTEKDIVYPAGYGDYTGKYSVLPAGFKAGKDQLTWVLSNYNPKRSLQIEMFPEKDVEKLITDFNASGIHIEDEIRFETKNAFDEDPASAWAIGGPGNDAWIYAKFLDKKWIREFRIIPGYASLESMFRFYNRPRKVTLKFSNGTSQQFELKDDLEMQYVPIKPVQTKWVALHIDSVYKGIYPDVTYISELEYSQVGTKSKVEPEKWQVGLNQVEALELKPRYNATEIVTVVATVLVFVFIFAQVLIALRMRRNNIAGK